MTRGRRGALALAAAAGAVALFSGNGRGRALDERLFAAVNRRLVTATLDRVAKGVTELGSLWASAGAGAVLALRGHRREARDALGAAAAMWLLGQALKRAVARPRPYDASGGSRLLIDPPQGTSWPSSHPAVLLAFVTVAARELALDGSMRAALGALTGAVAGSRVYLGVHYPSDVAGGLLLGRAVGSLWPSASRRRLR